MDVDFFHTRVRRALFVSNDTKGFFATRRLFYNASTYEVVAGEIDIAVLVDVTHPDVEEVAARIKDRNSSIADMRHQSDVIFSASLMNLFKGKVLHFTSPSNRTCSAAHHSAG